MYSCVGALVALTVAIIYLFVVPSEVSAHNGWQYVVLRFGHSVAWVLLGLASLLWGIRLNKLAQVCLYGALIAYVGFLAVLAS